jgi:NDP-sugar pyrophosphorylase family protein
MFMRAVILAGGKGTRLKPYTTVFPKPLMPVGDMPILEIILRQLAANRICDITIAVGHLAELIQAFFNNGSNFGVNIDYSMENKPLGTAGPLSLIDNLDSDFLVMNGDVLSTIRYADIIKQHKASKATCTIAVRKRNVKIDFGVLELDDTSTVRRYIEKPTYNYTVSMGIYVFSPTVMQFIKKREYLDFPDLVQLLLEKGEKVYAYQSDDYWLDIGRPDDYQQAVDEFEANRHLFLPDNN